MRDITSLMTKYRRKETLSTQPAERGNLLLGLATGLVAAIAGGVIWLLVGMATGLRLGIVAIVIGAMVGSAIRKTGRGSSIGFGIAGAVLTALGCLLGQALFQVELNSHSQGADFWTELRSSSPIDVIQQSFAHMTPITGIIYFAGISAGFRRSMILAGPAHR